mmetsp:Transcript_115957/g.322935  ORF Transcript_115957/g.322935 Transcript_115957/m.322935 type:complete len:435 (-) Transcript_115957:1658-2962(-)
MAEPLETGVLPRTAHRLAREAGLTRVIPTEPRILQGPVPPNVNAELAWGCKEARSNGRVASAAPLHVILGAQLAIGDTDSIHLAVEEGGIDDAVRSDDGGVAPSVRQVEVVLVAALVRVPPPYWRIPDPHVLPRLCIEGNNPSLPGVPLPRVLPVRTAILWSAAVGAEEHKHRVLPDLGDLSRHESGRDEGLHIPLPLELQLARPHVDRLEPAVAARARVEAARPPVLASGIVWAPAIVAHRPGAHAAVGGREHAEPPRVVVVAPELGTRLQGETKGVSLMGVGDHNTPNIVVEQTSIEHPGHHVVRTIEADFGPEAVRELVFPLDIARLWIQGGDKVRAVLVPLGAGKTSENALHSGHTSGGRVPRHTESMLPEFPSPLFVQRLYAEANHEAIAIADVAVGALEAGSPGQRPHVDAPAQPAIGPDHKEIRQIR